jgi:hypothetical protein
VKTSLGLSEMPVQSIECLLTQAQMKRYLGGAELPDESLQSLERHLKACPDCMEAANMQREALGGAPAAPATAVVAATNTGPASKLMGFFAKANRPSPETLGGAAGQDPYADPLAALKSPKNLVLSLSLASVLVLMSLIMRNPTAIFGPKAMEASKPKAEGHEAESTITNGDGAEKRGEETGAHGKSESKAPGHEESHKSTEQPKLTESKHEETISHKVQEPHTKVAASAPHQKPVVKDSTPPEKAISTHSTDRASSSSRIIVAESGHATKPATKPKATNPPRSSKKPAPIRHKAPAKRAPRRTVKRVSKATRPHTTPQNKVKVYAPDSH